MNRLPKIGRSKFHNEMFNAHTHAEQVFDFNPDQIVYTEKEVLKLLRFVRNETLIWAAENARTKYVERHGYYESIASVDQQSILKGIKCKDLKI